MSEEKENKGIPLILVFFIFGGIFILFVGMGISMIFGSIPKSDYQYCMESCRVHSQNKDICFSNCNETFLQGQTK